MSPLQMQFTNAVRDHRHKLLLEEQHAASLVRDKDFPQTHDVQIVEKQLADNAGSLEQYCLSCLVAPATDGDYCHSCGKEVFLDKLTSDIDGETDNERAA